MVEMYNVKWQERRKSLLYGRSLHSKVFAENSVLKGQQKARFSVSRSPESHPGILAALCPRKIDNSIGGRK